MRTTDILGLLAGVTAPDRVLPGTANDDYSHDEALPAKPQQPLAVVIPTTTAEVSAILRIANVTLRLYLNPGVTLDTLDLRPEVSYTSLN